MSEAYKDLSTYVEENANAAPPALEEVSRALAEISSKAYDFADYAQVRKRLSRLLLTIDAISVRFAVRDFTIQRAMAGFGGEQEKFPDANRLISEVERLLGRDHVSEVAPLRQLLDALGQWANDALVTSSSEDHLAREVELKAGVAHAAMYLNASLWEVALRGNTKSAIMYHTLGTRILGQIIHYLRKFPGNSAAKPKDREDLKTPFDPGSVMITAAVVADNFIPHLVVGLPTGGVHAANRVAGALLVRTGSAPLLWYTRPHAVKEASKELLKGVFGKHLLRKEEVDFLGLRLKDLDPLRILIVDDGATTGGTFIAAKELYEGAFKDQHPNVKKATVKGGRQVEADEVFQGDKQHPNVVDYVMNQTDDRAGPRLTLKIAPLSDDPQARTQGPKVSITAPVTIFSTGAEKSTSLRNVLDR